MSKFFNITSNKQNNNNANMNQFQSAPGVAPSPQMNGGNSQTETFVYNSVPKNQMNNGNYMNNMNVPNNQMGMQSGMPNQGMMQQAPMQGNMMPPQGVVMPPQGNMIPQSNMPQMNNGQNGMNNNSGMQQNVNNQVYQQQNTEMLEMPMKAPNREVKEEQLVDEYGNPISPVKEEFKEEDLPANVKANFFSTFGMFLGMIVSPGTTIVANSRKYRSTGKALSITFWITIVSLIICIASRALVGSFKKSYNAITGFGAISFDPSNIFKLSNYSEYLIIALIVSVVAICITALVYYASSFINSKGVHLGTYFMVSNLAMIPVIVGTLVVLPALSIISDFLGILGLIFSFVYTLFAFMVGMNDVLTFKNDNVKILYNAMNVSFVILVIYLLISMLIKLNILTVIGLGV